MARSLSSRIPGLATAAAATFLLASLAPDACLADPTRPPAKSAPMPSPAWTKVNVDLPASDAVFPSGPDADLANAHCLICHSAGMVLRQPALTKDQWRAEVVKMRSAFGALIPVEQVDALTEYLHLINGR